MVELLALGALFLVGGLVVAILGALFAVLRFALWLVFLPIRLAFKLIFLPLLILKWIVVGFVGLFAAPFLLLIAVVGGVAVLAALLAPLFPLIVAGLVIWALVQLVRRPVAA